VRHSLHQFADFRFQKFVRDDQRLHRVARVPAASRDCLVGRRFKPILCTENLSSGVVVVKSAKDGV
jgi:hypothetical protein